MRESEYRRDKKALEASIRVAEENLAKEQAKLAALELLWNEHYSKTVTQDTPGESRTVVVNGQAQSLIDEAASKFAGEFGVKEVEAALQSMHPDKTVNRTTIAGRLRKLVDDGKIELVQMGVGRRPGKFKGKAA